MRSILSFFISSSISSFVNLSKPLAIELFCISSKASNALALLNAVMELSRLLSSTGFKIAIGLPFEVIIISL